MSSEAPASPPATSHPHWLAGLRALVVLFVLGGVAARWDAHTGLTALLRFGDAFAAQQLPAVAALPVATVPGSGYDGQFYAQLAVEPDVRAAGVQHALDAPSYRARRILLPLVAHVLGGGDPWHTLHAYALLNVAAWLALAWLWWRCLPDHGLRGTVVWSASLLSLGALDSVRFSLTDLPMLLALVVATLAWQHGRRGLAAGALLVAGFVRETAVLGVTLFSASPLVETAGEASRVRRPVPAILAAAAVVMPVALWCLVLRHLAPGPAGIAGNFDWPALGWSRHLAACVTQLARGDLDSRHLFGLVGALSLAWQSIYVLRRAGDADRWLRLALPFAVLVWVLGESVWRGYWAAARTTLPLLFVFNRQILAAGGERRFWLHLAAGNAFLLHSVYRFIPGP